MKVKKDQKKILSHFLINFLTVYSTCESFALKVTSFPSSLQILWSCHFVLSAANSLATLKHRNSVGQEVDCIRAQAWGLSSPSNMFFSRPKHRGNHVMTYLVSQAQVPQQPVLVVLWQSWLGSFLISSGSLASTVIVFQVFSCFNFIYYSWNAR